MEKYCEYCGRETEWNIVYEERGLTIIQCKECGRVEHVYGKLDKSKSGLLYFFQKFWKYYFDLIREIE